MFVIALQISVSNLPPVPGAGVTESNNVQGIHDPIFHAKSEIWQ